MEGEDKEFNSQNPNQGTFLVRFKFNRMPEKTVETEPAPLPKKENHYCKECRKSFNSGKALGGHLSTAHVQSKKDYSFVKLNFNGKRGHNSLGSPAGKYCVICGREFPSRKALFGHMRSHPERQWRGMDPPPAELESSDDDGSSSTECRRRRWRQSRRRCRKKRTIIKDYSFVKLNFNGKRGHNSLGSPAGKYCVICGREFPSRKALFGHMRSHPERQWRGMDPPPSELESSDDDSSPSSEVAAPSPVADIASSLKGWCVTAKRGRPEISKPSPATADPLPIKDSDMFNNVVQKLVKFMENQSAKQDNEVEDVGSSSLVDDNHQFKKRKTESAIDVAEVKLTEAGSKAEAESRAEAETKAAAENIVQGNCGTSPKQNYVCTTCNRSFHSHQALGGHKSSHNKFKISIINAIDDDLNGNNKNNNRSRRQPGSYICTICHMSFSSGQALGSHKRSHKEEDEKKKKNKTARVEFEIDLNKLPDEE
ncbi:hypothetical protein CDL12_21320 [Handroanthus impetiginosus]|uniref:C2H2-type domain-containing protein n=1 Tax=Handroanthus impetiginosus TaxID=429701 RepID=A0A2G9GLJ0_9LAMI|nr:hypothetical protein CDL12_21320 [Handroanthus impetiginosus]